MAKNYVLWIAGIVGVSFLLQITIPGFTENFVLVSDDVVSRPWILLTAIFLHAGMAHILFNGLGLLMFGSILEEVAGSKKFLAIFLGAGLLSSIVSSFFYESVLGASGAIFGIIGALTVLRPNITVWAYFIPMPLYMAAIVWAAADFFGFVLPTGVANAGHLSGLAAGLLAGLLIRGRAPIARRRDKIPITAEEFDKWEKENM